MTTIELLVQELPPELQKEVEDFARFLLTSRVELESGSKPQMRLRLNWAGALSEFRDQFTSVELQKKSLDWWNK